MKRLKEKKGTVLSRRDKNERRGGEVRNLSLSKKRRGIRVEIPA